MSWLTKAHTGLGIALRFLLPWACAGCRTPLEAIEDGGFCGSCWLGIPRIDGLVCKRCGVPLKDGGETCFSCHHDPSQLVIRAATSFKFPIQPSIHRFKYAGRKSLAPFFKVLMGYAWHRYPELAPVDALVPVPLYSGVQRDRGYNQATLLAHGLAELLHLPVRDALSRPRRTRPQFHLTKAQRLTNLQNAFVLNPKISPESLKNQHILLIDDVCTTGTTLRECMRVLHRAGAAGVKALVLARDI